MEKEEEKVKPSTTNHHGGAEDEGAVAMDETATLSSPPWWWLSFTYAHPCSLLQYVVRACAGGLMDLCGGSCRGDRWPGTDDADAADDPAATLQRDEEGSKATHDRVGAQLLARRRPPPGRPGNPRPGRGGSHH